VNPTVRIYARHTTHSSKINKSVLRDLKLMKIIMSQNRNLTFSKISDNFAPPKRNKNALSNFCFYCSFERTVSTPIKTKSSYNFFQIMWRKSSLGQL
jgi:hypothetical protein